MTTSGLTLTPFDAAAILIVLAALLGYLNYRFLKLPASIGLTVMGAVASLIVVAIDRIVPGSSFSHDVVTFIAVIDFSHRPDGRHALVLAVCRRPACRLG